MGLKRKKAGSRAVGLARKRQSSPVHKGDKIGRPPPNGLAAEIHRAVKAHLKPPTS